MSFMMVNKTCFEVIKKFMLYSAEQEISPAYKC